MDVAFRVITANQKPDYSTICRFRSENETELGMLFTEVLRLCAEAGLVKAGVVALDGTKVKANASLSANRTQEHIEAEVRKMLTEAREEDRLFGKDSRRDEIPEELKDRRGRLAQLKECRERLAREKAEKVQAQAERIEKRQAEAVVDRGQIIIAADVTQEANDVHQLHQMTEKAQEELKTVGIEEEIGTELADTGYWSEDNMVNSSPTDPEFLVAITKDWKQRKALRE
jgi:phenylalanyl-tRNA synthetase alpha subunit